MQAVAEVVQARRRDHDFRSSVCRRYCGRGAVGDGVGDRTGCVRRHCCAGSAFSGEKCMKKD